VTQPAGAATATAPGFVDLHMHSTASDGSLPPAAVVAAARAAGLRAIALTDHDTLDGVAEARRVAEPDGLRVVAGTELSVVLDGRELHVLALHIERPAPLEAELVELRAARRGRAARIVERLNALGVPITLDAVLAEAGDGAIGRPHVARAMVAAGWARDFRDAFDRYLGNGRPAHVEKRRLEAGDAIRMVHEAGGIAVFAHPGPTGSRERIERLVRLGLDGVEVLHPSHTAEDIARLGTLVEHFGLVPSGGSDWHGSNDGPRAIGSMRVPSAMLARQDALVAARESSRAGAAAPGA
jgi:predicted metal-dependent phosphoesterase TrpH